MPYENERSEGYALIQLENSEALREFNGTILTKEAERVEPPLVSPNRRGWLPRRVIAIDGSHLVAPVKSGFPGASAGLLTTSVLAIKLDRLMNIDAGSIPRPSFFRDMESSHTLEAAMPGTNIVRKGVDGDTPMEFFRYQTYATLSNAIADDHETLLETFRDICDSYGLRTRISCPVSDCDKFYERKKGEYPCGCDRRETMFETDALRLHEYFANDVRGEGEALGRLRSVLEILTLFNILRFFAQKSPAYLKSCAFVLDGPLALFGTPASILRPIRAELLRLNAEARSHNGADIALFGIEKTGRFREHLTNLDWQDREGPGSRFPEQTAIALNDEYIKSNIAPGGKPFGADTHFGRVVLYKTLQGEHAVVNAAMLNEASQDADANSLECYPRLNDILDVALMRKHSVGASLKAPALSRISQANAQ